MTTETEVPMPHRWYLVTESHDSEAIGRYDIFSRDEGGPFLTSRDLAGLVTAMRVSYNRGGTATYRELVNEGALGA